MIYDVPPRIEHAGDGTTVAFAYPFRIFSVTDLEVTVDDVAQAGYAVTGVGNINGGTVTLAAAPADGAEIVITRDVPLSRTSDFVDGGDFRAIVFNNEYDRQVANIQEVAQRIEDIDVPELPDPIPGRQLGYNAAGEIVTTAYNADETRVVADGATALAQAASVQATAALAAIEQLEVDTQVRPDPATFTLLAGVTDYELPSDWPVNVTAPSAYQVIVDTSVIEWADYSLVGATGRTLRLADAPAPANAPTIGAYTAGSIMRVFLFAGNLPASAIADASITEPKYSTGSVSARALAPASVATEAVQDLAITAAKEADGTAKAVRVYNGSGRPAVVTGAAGQYLGFDGTGTPSAVPAPVIPPQTGGLIRVITDNVAGTRNYVKSANAVWTVVELAGGGGGGAYGSASASDVQGGPGGGPGYSFKTYDSTALAASVAYTVGAAGTAGSSSSESGGAGGDSIFGTQRANGGGGGTRPAVPPTGFVSTSGGGSAGAASNGDINETGSPGKNVNFFDSNINTWVALLNLQGQCSRTGGRGGPGGTSGVRTGSVGSVRIWEFK